MIRVISKTKYKNKYKYTCKYNFKNSEMKEEKMFYL